MSPPGCCYSCHILASVVFWPASCSVESDRCAFVSSVVDEAVTFVNLKEKYQNNICAIECKFIFSVLDASIDISNPEDLGDSPVRPQPTQRRHRLRRDPKGVKEEIKVSRVSAVLQRLNLSSDCPAVCVRPQD